MVVEKYMYILHLRTDESFGTERKIADKISGVFKEPLQNFDIVLACITGCSEKFVIVSF